jgi:hypothetical protein
MINPVKERNGVATADFLVIGILKSTPAYWTRVIFDECGWADYGKEYKVVDYKGRGLSSWVTERYESLLVLHIGQTTNRTIARVGQRFNQWCPFGPDPPPMPNGMGPYEIAEYTESSDEENSEEEAESD